MTATEFDWRSLEDPLPVSSVPAKPQKTHPCGQCAGTGKWRSPLGRKSGPCHACKGKGYFMASPAERFKKRRQVQARKERNLAEDLISMREQFPGLEDAIAANMWSEFIQDMDRQLRSKGSLSERQVQAVFRTAEKSAARKAERIAEREKVGTIVDLSRVEEMFATAKAAGLKAPIFRALGFSLSLAKATSVNAGAIYIKRDGNYLGKVTGGKYSAVWGMDANAVAEVKAALDEIAVNPREAAIRYGRETGICACCGAKLTDPVSVAAGIGPICAGKWGF